MKSHHKGAYIKGAYTKCQYPGCSALVTNKWCKAHSYDMKLQQNRK